MKILILAGKGESTTFLYNALKDKYCIETVIIEDKESVRKFVKRRIIKNGLLWVIDQIIFQLTIPKILRYTSKKRINKLKKELQLSDTPIETNKLYFVTSVNDERCLDLLKRYSPDLVIVNGTRIISKRIINSINSIFINSHVGITPEYRGVHGAYWALANNQPELCGVTIHIVDEGIDTGKILKQAIIKPTKEDNFATYPYLQYSKAIELVNEVIFEANNKMLNPYKKDNVESKLYYHPTFTGYIKKYLKYGIK